MKKNLLLFLILLALALFLFPQSVRADPPFNEAEDVGGALDEFDTGNINSQVTTMDYVTGTIGAWNCLLGGSNFCSNDPKKQGALFKKSVVGYTQNAIAFLYLNKPADTKTFIAYYGQKLGIVKPALARTSGGIGFSGLSPILPLWRAFRNIAYGFVILILLFIGFMILFRMKIDPRTVISIQNALPRVITTLILITFSYAIAGILIDLMYVLIFLIIGVFNAAFPLDLTNVYTQFTGGGLSTLYSAMMLPGRAVVDDIATLIANIPGATTIIGVASALAGAWLGNNIGGSWIGAVIGGVGVPILSLFWGGPTNTVVHFLIWLAIAFTFIRLFITLINAYISILLSIIFAPLQIMAGAVPNSNAFGSWFKNLIANLAVFPIVTALMILATILSGLSLQNINTLWTPPGLSGTGLNTGAAGIIGIGIMFIIPVVANSIKEMLKAKPIIPSGTSAVFAPISSVYGTTTQALSSLYYFQHIGATGLFSRVRERLGTWFKK